ncbi:E3 ubiquitin-protein ligase RNF5 [Nematocida displodere]|uniref:RING-type E3 ubiquitin transferase n=1 Tax=Nematocida displodere TaxID=1805483 RepID=A0A177EFA5_9MICR|nr:E3 ubiquitin-protein ligase RNF5 [Nematocida displodere]
MEEQVVSKRATGSFDFDCSICMSLVEAPVVTQCGHLFCWGCLHGWGAKSNICPVCKNACQLSSVIPIYSKGTGATALDLPKPPSTNRCVRIDNRPLNIHYTDGMRIFHMEEIAYRYTPSRKDRTFTALLFVVTMLLCIYICLLY